MSPQLRNIDVDVSLRSLPHLDQYFGVWAMLASPFRGIVERASHMDLIAHVEQVAPSGQEQTQRARGYELIDGVAVIEMRGMMTKYGSSLSPYAGSLNVRRAIRGALSDTAVRGILLLIASPGGSVAGTGDLADDVYKAAQAKPVVAFIEDVGASAAYYVASQASLVVANPAAAVGSIGVYGVLYDYSAQAAQMGVKAYVIRSGKFKGIGTPGEDITQEQLSEVQREVDQFHELFVEAVARGREKTQAEVMGLADGAVHVGQHALSLGLVDAIGNYDAARRSVAEQYRTGRGSARMGRVAPTPTEDRTMANDMVQTDGTSATTADAGQTDSAATENPKAPSSGRPASLAELKAALPDSTAAFREECIEGHRTLDQAKDGWMEHLRASVEAKDEALAEAQKASEARAKRPGVEGAGGYAADGKQAEAFEGDAVETFNGRVAEKVVAGMDRRKAIVAVARADHALHEAYLRATNPQNRKVQELIGERFEL